MPGWTVERELVVEDRLKALGFLHGVTTRPLGNMKEPEARERALGAAGVPAGSVAFLRQVHGRAIWRWPAPAESWAEGDGWLADRSGAGLGIFVADCLPLFMWTADGKSYGLAHVGWRGAAEGMPQALVEAFKARGAAPSALRAGLGPSIRGCCYRVGPEVAARFSPEAVSSRDGGVYVDLALEARAQLERCGVPGREISDAGLCTHSLPDQFYSFRREKTDVRMMAFLFRPHAASATRERELDELPSERPAAAAERPANGGEDVPTRGTEHV